MGTLTLGFVTSCSDDQLETSPTDRVSGSTMEGSADAAMIAMNGIYRSMYTAGWSTAGNSPSVLWHFCLQLDGRRYG